MSTKYHPLTEWALEQQKKWKGLKETDKEADRASDKRSCTTNRKEKR